MIFYHSTIKAREKRAIQSELVKEKQNNNKGKNRNQQNKTQK